VTRSTRLLGALLSIALACPAAVAADLPAPTTPASRQKKAREYFTDTVLVNQDGKQVRFYSDVLDGNVVILSFVFTRCVEACPLICQKLNGVRRHLGDDFRHVRFVSFSVDPEFDTPAELTRFAAKMEAVYSNWTFLGGKKENVSFVLKRLGEWPEEPGDHTTAFMAGNVRTGHWTKIRPDMPAAAIADTLRRLVAEDQGDGESPPRAAN
jgi:protein SCO1/2